MVGIIRPGEKKKVKAFQGNLLNYLTSRLTKRHGQTVHLQRPVVITAYKRKLSLFREVNISSSEKWTLVFIYTPEPENTVFLSSICFAPT